MNCNLCYEGKVGESYRNRLYPICIFFKNAPIELHTLLFGIYNTIYFSGKELQCFKDSIIYLFHGKGEIDNADNSRGIAFEHTVGNIFTGLTLTE